MSFKLLVGILLCLIYSLPTVAHENKVVLAYVEYPPYYGQSLRMEAPLRKLLSKLLIK